MRKLLLLLLLALSCSAAAAGQAVSATPIAINQNGVPLGSTLVTVCTSNPGTASCGSKVTLYTSIALATACTGTAQPLNNQSNPLVGSGCSNPGYTDNLGNVIAFSVSGPWWCQFSGPTIQTYSVPCPSGGGSASSFTVSTNGTPNIGAGGLNFQTSTTNANGLTVTPVNASGINQLFEVTGNYSGDHINLTTGIQLNSSYGTSGQALCSNGVLGSFWGSCGGGGGGVTLQVNGTAFLNGSLLNFTNNANGNFINPSGGILQFGLLNPSAISYTDGMANDAGGSANVYAACPGTPNPILGAGLQIHFIAQSTNTGSSTFNLCGTGAVTIVKNGIANLIANDIQAGGDVYLQQTLIGNWALLDPMSAGGSGSVSGQQKAQATIGCGTTCITTSAGAQYTSQQTGSDLCTRIRNAFAACTTSACHVLIDEGGKQFCSVQPFLTASGNTVAGYAEVFSNGTPLNLWLDGISSIEYGSGFQFNGHAESGSSAGASGGASNTNLVLCNPALMTCPSGGFKEENGSVTSTTAGSGQLTITVSGAPFTTCQANAVCTNTGSNQPTTCDTGHSGTGGCANMVALYRLLCIYNSATANNNGCYPYKTTVSFNGNQSFTVNSASGLTSCASSCGTVYLDTPAIVDTCDSGCNGGTYETDIRDFTIQGMFLPGSGGFVHAAGEELTTAERIQVFNTMAYFWRFDQSSAYAGAPNGDTNSGPFGPFSGNMHNVQCQKTTCSCVANSGSGGNQCSAGGTIASGGFMFCGGTTTNPNWAQLSPDPCVNPNFVGALFTGGSGSQGPDIVFHQTLSISTLSGTSLSDFSGSGSSQGTGFGIFGAQAELSHTHEEYFPTGFAICGDSSRQAAWYNAYHAVPTAGIILRGGLNGSNTGLYFDIGDATTTYGNNNLCANINIEGVFGGTGGAGTLTDNVTKHNMNLSTDAPVSFFLGTGNNPPVRTSQGNGGFSGPVNFPAGICQGGIGQTASAFYYLPPYVENTTGSPCTVVSSKAFGIASPHACIAQNLTCSLGTAPAAGDTITCNANNNTSPTTALGCSITSSTPGLKCVDTLKSDNFLVSQGDQVLIYYSPSQASDASAADVHAMFDCF